MKTLPDFSFESALIHDGCSIIAGVDEAGRGPLAGSVYAAAAILPPDFNEPVNDSKLLTESERSRLFDIIIKKAVAYAVASASVSEIEELNILEATYLAMNRAVSMLNTVPDISVVDGNRGAGLNFPHKLLIKGDQISISIAAASILAKVSRDRYMASLANKYPGYGFDKHKGYGTSAHIEAIKNLGLTPEHRKLFVRKIAYA